MQTSWYPGFLQYKEGSVLDATEKYILAACHTFSQEYDNKYTAQIFQKFPYSDVYKFREGKRTQRGTFKVYGNGQDQRYVMTLFTQRLPWGPFMYGDHDYNRFRFFISAMQKVYRTPELESIALQRGFSVGTKGHIWKQYEETLAKFAKKFPQTRTVIYCGNYIRKMVNLAKKESQNATYP